MLEEEEDKDDPDEDRVTLMEETIGGISMGTYDIYSRVWETKQNDAAYKLFEDISRDDMDSIDGTIYSYINVSLLDMRGFAKMMYLINNLGFRIDVGNFLDGNNSRNDSDRFISSKCINRCNNVATFMEEYNSKHKFCSVKCQQHYYRK